MNLTFDYTSALGLGFPEKCSKIDQAVNLLIQNGQYNLSSSPITDPVKDLIGKEFPSN